MFVRAGEPESFERQLPPITLPLSSEEWTRHFEAHLRTDEGAQAAYDEAHVCEVEFSADELGIFALRCEREFTPLRWSLKRDSSGFLARLHDDAGRGAPTIERYSFERPNTGEELPSDLEHRAPRAGGLYVATLGDFKATIIVPPIVKGLADLRCEPKIESGQRTPETVATLLSSAQLWGKARLSGDLIAGARRGVVLRALTSNILSLVGGRAWASAESKLKDEQGLVDLKRCISDKGYELGLGSGLQLEYQALANEPPSRRAARLASLAESFRLMQPSANQREVVERSSFPGLRVLRRVQGVGPEHSEWFSEFALRVASDPVTVSAWAGEYADASIKKLLDVPTLARAARFLVLAVDQRKKSRAIADEVYAGWRWSA
jgi:hypothetical protein